MLRACVLEYGRSWDYNLALIEFAYDNSYNSSIGMLPYKMLYGRKCQTPSCWLEAGEKQFAGVEIVQQIAKKVAIAREKLKAARDQKKMHAYPHRQPVTFTYKVGDENQILVLQDLKVDSSKKLVEEPVRIVDRKVTKLQKKQIPMMLVEWKHSLGTNLTWETEELMTSTYPHLFNREQIPRTKSS
ncbi:uncharacterized protein [Rutidosis leptorrhynchoides]|uniref:uncharacterized protein n=1 Tax=Rutidosis leptorrhynchoides TaxID=125765 RepID=UPI003A99423A